MVVRNKQYEKAVKYFAQQKVYKYYWSDNRINQNENKVSEGSIALLNQYKESSNFTEH